MSRRRWDGAALGAGSIGPLGSDDGASGVALGPLGSGAGAGGGVGRWGRALGRATGSGARVAGSGAGAAGSGAGVAGSGARRRAKNTDRWAYCGIFCFTILV
jgi:streptogrisin D